MEIRLYNDTSVFFLFYRRNYMRFKKIITGISAIVLAAVMLVAALPITSFASSNYDLRKKVVSTAGIMNTNVDVNQYVSRQEFARMLIKASSYRDILTTTSNVSVFADVAAGSEYAAAIRLCAEHGYMTSFLGGKFKPEQSVTLNEAEKGLLSLLGYTNSDFTGDQYSMRHAKAGSIALLEEVNKTGADTLTYTDCINLFYNLLKCKTKENKDYVTVLGGTLASDGQVNATSFGTTNLVGPKFFINSSGVSRLNSWLPFAANDGSVYLDGELVGYDALKSEIEGSGAVVYYTSANKAVWAYSLNSSVMSGKGAYRGTIDGIEYAGADTITPTGVSVDGNMYKLTSSDMQFAFSMYGSCKVGETVTIIYTALNDGNYDGTVVDYIYND